MVFNQIYWYRMALFQSATVLDKKHTILFIINLIIIVAVARVIEVYY
jgi:hypothetical protein